MSVDVLQEKIRKLKNPSVVDFSFIPETVPASMCEEEILEGYVQLADKLLQALKDIVPAVRFGMGSFALMGSQGLAVLSARLRLASELGYYVILDIPEMLSGKAAETAAQQLASECCPWCFDALVIGSYLGADVYRPFVSLAKQQGKAVFAVVRTSNKTAPEVQDLLTGSRMVHNAVADIVNRLGEPLTGKLGYSNFSALAGAGSAGSLRTLREKYKAMFLLLDGYDYPNANAKNCSYAFDQFGHGAAACAGISILGAWKEAETDDCAAAAVEAAQRMKKNLNRYISIL